MNLVLVVTRITGAMLKQKWQGSMAGAGKLEIDVQVRLDKLESQLKQVESSVNKTGRRVEATAGKFDKMAAGIGKVTAVAGKLAIAAAAIDAGIKGATAQVHMMKGAWALLKGDTDGALKSLEAYGETIRSLPIIGGILGGIADSLYGFADAVLGITENLEKLEKQLVKVQAEAKTASTARAILVQNNRIKEQIALLKETNEGRKAEMTLAMQLADLEVKRKTLRAQVTNEHVKGTKVHKLALKQIDEQIELEKEMLEVKHQQAESDRITAERRAESAKQAAKLKEIEEGNQRVKVAEDTLDALQDQLKIQLAQTDEDKRRATMMAQQNAIMREFAEREKQILANTTLTSDQRQKLLDLLTKEKNLKIDLVRLADDAARKAEREAEQQRKKAEQLKEQKKLLEEQQRLDEKRSREIEKRLGMASGSDSAPTKQGFMETASTAMGSFSFGEQGAQEKIRALQKEQLDLQKSMDQRLESIDNLVRAMNQSMGFS